MIQLYGIYKSFGSKGVLEGIDLFIDRDTHLGIVGKNGVGKSTLLSIIAGKTKPDDGKIIRKEGITIGYLPQKDITFKSDLTLLDVLLRANTMLFQLKEKLKLFEKKDPIKYAKLLDEYQIKGGFEEKAKISKIMKKLGFKEEDAQKKISDFSGGWQKRIKLAEVILAEPDILLLDEPTNNLDAIGISWLIEYLKNFKGAYVIVSHDRYLLDMTTDKTGELNKGKLKIYPASYSMYVKLKEKEQSLMQKKYEETIELIQRYRRYIERNRYDKKTAGRARARAKMLERIEVPEKPEIEEYPEFRIYTREHLPTELLRCKNIHKSFGETKVLRGIDLIVRSGERIGILGENGSGKSTLLRILAKRIRPDKGEVFINPTIEIGYYSQIEEEEIDEEKTPWELLLEERENITYKELFTLLATFGLKEEVIETPFYKLSGGERQRTRLMLLFSKRRDLLILDEVTNHLDLYSREALEKAILSYKGGIIFVSHDRYFTEKIKTHYFLLKDGKLSYFTGNYDDFVKLLEKSNEKPSKDKTLSKEQEAKTYYIKLKERQKRERKLKRNIERKLSELQEVEAEIEEFEKKEKDMLRKFEKPDEIDENTYIEYESIKKELKKLYRRWEELSIEIEKLEEDLKEFSKR